MRPHSTALLGAFALLVTACGAAPDSRTAGMLGGRVPSQVRQLVDAARITDGRVPDEGAAWRSDETAVGRKSGAFVEFDLGRRRRIGAAWLQADHNDRYVLSTSGDDRNFAPAWAAEPVAAGGLRARYRGDLDVTARYVRLAPEGGDGLYSVSELRLYEGSPRPWPPAIPRVQPEAPNAPFRVLLAWCVIALCLLVLVATPRLPRWALIAVSLPACAALLATARAGIVRYPLDLLSESAIRAAVALVAAVCVTRLAMGRGRWAVQRGTALAILGGAAVVAFASFFHFGRPQFYDQARRQPSFVHYLDMRVYFPVAKYFRELGFDGVYAASVAALADAEPGLTLDNLGETQLRDLRNHRVMRVREVRDHIAEVRARFSDARWAEFIDDMRYFDGAMGRGGYLGSLLDHGGNATPWWLAQAHWLFRTQRATHSLFVVTGLMDPLLLILALAAIAWSFGPVAALVCMLVFGANDFHMGGYTNWAGATLRHDWMAALGFALAFLNRGKHALGGAFLALSGFLRAFPAFAFLGIAAAVVLWVLDERRATGRLPAWGRLREAQTPALHALAGGAVASVAFFAVSVGTLGASAWAGWLHKVQLLSSEPRVNHMGLRALLYYDFERDIRASSERALAIDWVAAQERAFAGRVPVYYVLALALTLLVVFACRRQPPARAALLGLVLFVVWLYPANYYIHFVFVLPLLADVPRGLRGFALSPAAAGIWAALCLMCAAEYASVIEPYLDRHYFLASLCLMGALLPCVTLSSPDLRHFFFSLSARARSLARTRLA